MECPGKYKQGLSVRRSNEQWLWRKFSTGTCPHEYRKCDRAFPQRRRFVTKSPVSLLYLSVCRFVRNMQQFEVSSSILSLWFLSEIVTMHLNDYR